MKRDSKSMTCEEFQEQLARLFESEADVDLHEHALRCEVCRALVRDLYEIEREAYPSWVFLQKPPSR